MLLIPPKPWQEQESKMLLQDVCMHTHTFIAHAHIHLPPQEPAHKDGMCDGGLEPEDALQEHDQEDEPHGLTGVW